MKLIAILIICVLIYYFFFMNTDDYSEYENTGFVKLYNHENCRCTDKYHDNMWAAYYASDGQKLQYVFQEPIDRVEFNFPRRTIFELYGYSGAGIPEIESIAGISDVKPVNENWTPIIQWTGPTPCVQDLRIFNSFTHYYINLLYF